MSGTSPEITSTSIHIELFGGTHMGRVRKNNEDNFLVADITRGVSGLNAKVKTHTIGIKGTLLLVSDGMGGALAGEVASRMAVEHLYQELVIKQSQGQPENLLLTAIERANQAIFHTGQTTPQYVGMGTTITAAIVDGPKVYIAEVGDSRAYLVRAGKIIQLTKDQSVVQRLIDEGVITPKQAARHPNRNLILQALGTHPQINVVMTKLELRRDDILLLCTDGLSNKVPDEEIKDIVLGSMSVESACRNLIEAANRHGGEDNITVVLGRLTGAGLPDLEVNLDTTDSTNLQQLKETLKKLNTMEIRPRGHRTQEIFRRTQPIMLSRTIHSGENKFEFAPQFIDLESSPQMLWKGIVLVLAIIVVILILLKLF